jgi:multiple sugar transport system ATP-binding protein
MEYLGTTQIVTVKTAHGQVKVRLPASMALKSGENVGLTFLGSRLSIFQKANGRAIKTLLRSGDAYG